MQYKLKNSIKAIKNLSLTISEKTHNVSVSQSKEDIFQLLRDTKAEINVLDDTINKFEI